MALCLAVSLLLHLAVLAYPGSVVPGNGAARMPSGIAPAASVSVRFEARLPTTKQREAQSVPHAAATAGIQETAPSAQSQQPGSQPFHPAPSDELPGNVTIHDWAPEIPRAMLEGLIPGPRYLKISELHRHPIPTQPIRPDYPVGAEQIHGRVLVLILINEKGEVDRAGIVAAQPAGVFDISALAAFRSQRYAPGLVAGIPVRSQLLVEVSYEPGDQPQVTVSAPSTAVMDNNNADAQANSLGKGN